MTCEEQISKIKVVIADDHEMVRSGIRKMISKCPHIEFLGEARNGREAIDMVAEYSPDIIISDIIMPVMTGIEAVRELRQINPDIRIIMLSAMEEYAYIEDAISAGANAYLSKIVSSKELIEAIDRVYQGERVFSSSILKIIEDKYRGYDIEKDEIVSLSKREQEVLDQIALGKTNQEVADELFISKRTVEVHRKNIMQKLGIKNAAELMKYALVKHLKT